MNKVLDLRSDTVTRPTNAMREHMMRAKVGDDVFSDDPSVNALEAFAADYFGKESALFLVSGTQSNLCALLAHCQRGEEYIVGQNAHTYRYEGGGAAVLGSIQPQPLEHAADGTIPLEKIEGAIKPKDSHFARTKLICLENTIGGKVISQEYINQVYEIAQRHQLGFHLDGARLMNASVSQTISAKEIAAPFDSVSICLSKGLGAPVGSLLVGSKPLISDARRWRKMLGGGTRQAGFLAAAGHYALENYVDRLKDDHENAAYLAAELGKVFNEKEGGISVLGQHTNMVFLGIEEDLGEKLKLFLEEKNILIYVRGAGLRLVLHLDIEKQDLDYIVDNFTTFLL